MDRRLMTSETRTASPEIEADDVLRRVRRVQSRFGDESTCERSRDELIRELRRTSIKKRRRRPSA